MQRTSFPGFRQWLLAGTLALGMIYGLTSVTSPAFAEVIPGDPDHLKCYEVLQDAKAAQDKVVNLFNKFGLEPGCHVLTQARLFCTPVSKFIDGGNGDDIRGDELNTDFTCYRVACPANPVRELEVDDQFGTRNMRIKDARLLCTPTESGPAAD